MNDRLAKKGFGRFTKYGHTEIGAHITPYRIAFDKGGAVRRSTNTFLSEPIIHSGPPNYP